MPASRRFTVVEYAKPATLVEQFARNSGIPSTQVRDLLFRAVDRVRRVLGLDSVPIFSNADRIQFQNFAGLFVIAPGLELEIVPKFLGKVAGWSEDFFLLATLSHHGRLLDGEELRFSSQATSDLSTLIGRSLVEMYWRNQRRPLRAYRRLHERSFAIEGDFDPEDLFSPDSEGFPQQVTSFTRSNPYNAVIGAAASRLATIVPDAETRARLERVVLHLPQQARPTHLKGQRLPSRSRSWQPTYDLSRDILKGFGGGYDPKNGLAPGFVVHTWRVWEDLVSLSLRTAFGGHNVSLQSRHRLGTRQNRTRTADLSVFPDTLVSVSSSDGTRRVLVDAKYKGHVEGSSLAVSNADIYEALAFSRATGINDVVLVYPRRIENGVSQIDVAGHAAEFSRIVVDDICIRAVEMGVCEISKRGGLKKFAHALAAIL